MSTRALGTAAIAAGLLAAPLAGAPATATTPQVMSGWTTIASHCSESGDVCYGIRKKGHKIQFRLDSFVDFGSVEFCVRKAHKRNWVCNTRDLKPRANDIYRAKIRWQGNYPTSGDAERVVRFLKGAKKLRFQP